MLIFTTLVVIVLTTSITFFMRRQRYIRKCLEQFPGPPNLFFFGMALDFLGDKGMLDIFLNHQEQYGDIIYGRIGPTYHGLVFSNADFAKTVFLANTNLSKGNAYDNCRCWLGEGLLTATEEKWKAQRKMINPAFNIQLLTDFIKIFDQQSKILKEKLGSIAPIDSVNVHPLIGLCSLDIICDTSMGRSLNAQKNQNLDYVKSVQEMCRIISDRSTSMWKTFRLLYIFSEDYRRERRILKILNSYTNNIITERKKQRKETKEKKEDLVDETVPGKRKLCLLDILLEYSENEKKLTQEEIKQEVNTFMFAGFDTSTAAMSFFLYEIAKNSEIQKLILDEQKSIFGIDRGRNITFNDIQEMRYLEMVIKETLRMYPPVPVHTRMVTKEFKFGDKVIPEGTLLIHFTFGLHRNEKYFPNPDVFYPTRFENMDGKIPHSFLPFSTGPRNCIGQKFAMLEMKVILSKLVRYFEFSSAEPEHKLDLRAEIVLQSRTGINVKITPRSKF